MHNKEATNNGADLNNGPFDSLMAGKESGTPTWEQHQENLKSREQEQ